MMRWLVAANVLIPLAVLIFATGFFPYKPFIPGLASHDDFAGHELLGDVPRAQFDKIIFMVVDALRSDFVFSNRSGFAFTQSLIRQGDALPFTAHASSPTITMPKVKAITTGSIPSFLDVILNFAESDTSSSLALQDTWIAQIRAGHDRQGNGRLVMYGDDTWLKLFPQTFVRADGTSSFFVSDFTEVDNNVTRHIPNELANSDWDAMIMHYLGLDHIGHKAGPLSPNMLPKQEEMDHMVETVFRAMDHHSHLSNTLLVLCGDHGMTDGGNHGGSSAGETSPALVFISSKLRNVTRGLESPSEPHEAFSYYQKVDQSDLAPSIAALLGLPVPKNNLGIIVGQLLDLWPEALRVDLLLRNALQMLPIVQATFPSHDFASGSYSACQKDMYDADALACKWQFAKLQVQSFQKGSQSASSSLTALYAFLRHGQEVMSSTASSYDVTRLILAVVLMGIAFIVTCCVCVAYTALWSEDMAIFCGILGLYSIMMFASSYVEEEQQFWHWIAAGWIAYLHLTSTSSRRKQSTMVSQGALMVFLAHRVAQRWNQTGQKHAGAPDIVNTFVLRYPLYTWTMVSSAYIVSALQVCYSVATYLKLGLAIGTASAFFLAMPSAALKLSFIASDAPELLYFLSQTQLDYLRALPVIQIARLFFSVLAVLIIFTLTFASTSSSRAVKRTPILHTVFSLLTFLLITQIRTHNIPLIALFITQHKLLGGLRLSPAQISITTLVMAHASFFALGNSNAISSVDLSNGYNGVSGFNVIAVGVLVFISNWAGPIFWSLSGVVLLSDCKKARSVWTSKVEKQSEDGNELRLHFAINILFISGSTLAMMIACTVLRTHLFIWTVFSPKYLYTMAWSLGYHYLVTLGLCGGLWRITRHLA